MSREGSIECFEASLPFNFKDRATLELAFVHSSYVNERSSEGLESNERLEFLGDAVVGLVVSKMLYENFPGLAEGELTRFRARLVNRRTLAGLGREWGLGPLLLLGRGELMAGGRENPTILSNTFEAVLGAAFLDQGYAAAAAFIEEVFTPLMETGVESSGHFGYKPELQEIAQRFFKEPPQYRVIDEQGPAHERVFTVEVLVDGEVLGMAEAGRKKDAEQGAAEEAIRALGAKGYSLRG
ncbi:Ribonuclease III [hydrothermal vent metagenome]|uniref:ribonuclease III n=1 Tax=hydrothermal vent metagenome TaxID=652676 RepID=A0A3B0UXN1_9ZZZZ